MKNPNIDLKVKVTMGLHRKSLKTLIVREYASPHKAHVLMAALAYRTQFESKGVLRQDAFIHCSVVVREVVAQTHSIEGLHSFLSHCERRFCRKIPELWYEQTQHRPGTLGSTATGQWPISISTVITYTLLPDTLRWPPHLISVKFDNTQDLRSSSKM